MVLQHTPLLVTVALPSEVTVPPEVAVEKVMSLTGEVVTVNEISLSSSRRQRTDINASFPISLEKYTSGSIERMRGHTTV